MKKMLCVVWAVICLLSLTSCQETQMKEYYLQKENYVSARGKLIHFSEDKEINILRFGFEELNQHFSGRSFCIEGDNLKIVKERGIFEKIQIGNYIDFITAPKYFGDGYVMPLVGITVDGEELLSFEEGWENYLEFKGWK